VCPEQDEEGPVAPPPGLGRERCAARKHGAQSRAQPSAPAPARQLLPCFLHLSIYRPFGAIT
jgi:hypothetical protein